MRYQCWRYDGESLRAIGERQDSALHPWITPADTDGHQIIGIRSTDPIPDTDAYPDAILHIEECGRHIVFGWRGDAGMRFVLQQLHDTCTAPCIITVIDTPEWLVDAHYQSRGNTLGELLRAICNFHAVTQ